MKQKVLDLMLRAIYLLMGTSLVSSLIRMAL